MQIVPPDLNVNFMGATRITTVFSILLVTASIVALSIFGLNLGTDFKGGTKLVVAFKEGSDVKRADIEDAIKDVVEQKAQTRDIQVEVTDYDTGGAGGAGQRAARHGWACTAAFRGNLLRRYQRVQQQQHCLRERRVRY